MLKQIFIPVAALVLTATAASAFTGGDMLSKLSSVNLTDTEKAALTEAQEVRDAARENAQQIIEKAGITDERMAEIREAMHEAREAEHQKVKAAIEAKDYEAFKAAADERMLENIDSAEKFTKLVEAHNLREDGKHDEAKVIMEELGLKGPGMGEKGQGGHRGGDKEGLDN